MQNQPNKQEIHNCSETKQPTKEPSSQATKQPRNQAAKQPSSQGTKLPSNQGTKLPSNQAAKEPSCQATKQPSNQAAKQPSSQATKLPSNQAAKQPSKQAGRQASSQGTKQPSKQAGRQAGKQEGRQANTRMIEFMDGILLPSGHWELHNWAALGSRFRGHYPGVIFISGTLPQKPIQVLKVEPKVTHKPARYPHLRDMVIPSSSPQTGSHLGRKC